jgi:hypothetical protein
MFSAQTKEGARAASEILLIQEDQLDETPERKDFETLPSAGVKALSEDEEEGTVAQHREFDVEELPDDEDRVKIPAKDPAEENKPVTFERLLGLGSGEMVSGG